MDNFPFSDDYKKAKEQLILFGITEREASIYFALLFAGESRASEIASSLGIHRLDVYHDLKSLQSKDMVEATISKPMKFKATSLDAVLRVVERNDRELFRAKTNALLELRKFGQKLYQEVHTKPKNGTSQGNKFQIIGGRRSINEKWAHLLTHAEKEILVTAIDKGPAKVLLMREIDSISKKMKAGVNVRIFTPVTKSNMEQFKEAKSEVRHLPSTTSAGICIVDRKEVMIIPESSDNPKASSAEETAILISSPSIVEMFRVLFFVGWDTSPLSGDST